MMLAKKCRASNDISWLPHAISVTTANVTDRQSALDAIEQNKDNLSMVTSILVDGGYTGRVSRSWMLSGT
jgi:hypothetical protein